VAQILEWNCCVTTQIFATDGCHWSLGCQNRGGGPVLLHST